MDFFSSPLLTAARGGHECMVRLLLDHGANIEAKLSSTCVKSFGIIERLFMFGDYTDLEIDAKSRKIGYTSLHLAVENGERRVVRTLIQYGANVNSKSKLNIPPIFIAIVNDQESIIQLLKKGGVNFSDIVNDVTIYQHLILWNRSKIQKSKKQNSHKDSNSNEEVLYSSCEL